MQSSKYIQNLFTWFGDLFREMLNWWKFLILLYFIYFVATFSFICEIFYLVMSSLFCCESFVFLWVFCFALNYLQVFSFVLSSLFSCEFCSFGVKSLFCCEFFVLMGQYWNTAVTWSNHLLWLFKTTIYFCFSFCLFNSYQSLHMWLDDIWKCKSV